MDTNLNRRDLIKLFTAAAVAGPLALAAPEPGAPLFFTKDEFAMLDTLTELIIPTDDHSPGAHAAGVAPFIDKTVAEAFLPEDKTSWRNGLAAVNEISQTMFSKSFSQASHEQQIELLKKISQNEKEPKTEPEKFFGQLKETTAFVYYTTSIGIHQDIEYKGNVILEQFVGYLPNQELPPVSNLG
ncbi:MAG: gluconate 2-dehydrogenase subunit 3 family protein [Acidobacteriaceae bacterium]|nr:gluconate 2-dehydrogenase subunit 3 family protein [Acidobacteriaceae bacterium]